MGADVRCRVEAVHTRITLLLPSSLKPLCPYDAVAVVVFREAWLVRQGIMSKHRVISGGAGAVRVWTGGGVLLKRY